MDHAAWLKQGLEETDEAREAYRHYMRPDPDQREFEGPIQSEFDDLTKREMRFRMARVGMTRGADLDKAKLIKVYLDPMPHIRIDKAKPLQGWYQNKETLDPVTGRHHRPRPCFTDAILTEPYGGYCTVGCAFSLPAGELIDTPRGPAPIESIPEGAFVWGRSQQGTVLARVTGRTKHWKVEGYVVLKLFGNKRLRLTTDHPVYSVTRKEWIAAGDLRRGEELEEIQFKGDGAACAHRSREVQGPRSSFAQQGRSEVGGDATANERGRSVSSGGDVSASLRTEDSRVESGSSRARSSRNIRLQNVETISLHGPQGASYPDAVTLGSLDGCLDGQAEYGLGVRAPCSETPLWSVLPSGLSVEGWPVHRSQRVLLTEGSSQDCGSEGLRSSHHPLPSEADETYRHPRVETITRVEGGLYVYDIETTTQNFYQAGILVHNCYVNSGFRGYRGSGLISVPTNYGWQVEEMLKKMRVSAAGYFSSFTDPFLPLEDYYHNTRRGARAFVKAGLPIFFLSRLAYPGWSIDLLQQSRYSYAQKSINTPDSEDWKQLSPGAISLEEHMNEIRMLSRRGIYVSIQVNPIVPGITSHDQIEQLFEMLAEAGANHVIVKFVEAGYSWAGTMVQRMMKRFGHNRAAEFERLFVQNIGGEKTVEEEYRMEGHRRYQKKATALGLTYATCYEYRQNVDTEGNKTKGSGVSVGREFITADQCHGHRVPMFERRTTDAPFTEIAECPPTGCLHCADDNGGKPKCGSDLLGAAKALRQPDLRKAVR